MKIILLIITFGGVILFEVPGLIQIKYWRELIVFFVLLSLGFILYFLRIVGVDFPSITGTLIKWIGPYLKFKG